MLPQADRRVNVDPAAAADKVADWCGHVGIPPRDEWDPADVVELLRRMDFAVTPGVVLEFQRKGYIRSPGPVWAPADVFCLAYALESRRRWREGPGTLHDVKKSGARIEIERLKAEGVDPPIHDLDTVTLEDLLLQLTQSDSRAAREVLYETLRLKLSGFEE